MRIAPWTDFKDVDIYENDMIRHPSGEIGRVVYDLSQTDVLDQWQVEYTDGALERLCDQIGIKGQAQIVRNTNQN